MLPASAETVPTDSQFKQPVRREDTDQNEAGGWDVVMSILMAVTAVIATLPVIAMALSALYSSRIRGSDLTKYLLMAAWSGCILGAPLLIIIRHWVCRVHGGNFNRSWIWRDYWYFQAWALTAAVVAAFILTTASQMIYFLLKLTGK